MSSCVKSADAGYFYKVYGVRNAPLSAQRPPLPLAGVNPTNCRVPEHAGRCPTSAVPMLAARRQVVNSERHKAQHGDLEADAPTPLQQPSKA